MQLTTGYIPTNACRPGVPPRGMALPLRRRLPPVAAAGAASPDQQSAFGQLVASGAKPTKTAVSKLSVAELRAECGQLGLPADGLKPALVERLLTWWEAQRQQPQQAQQAQQVQPETAPDAGAEREAAAGQLAGQAAQAAQAAAAPASAPSSGLGESGDAQQRQEQAQGNARAEQQRQQQPQQQVRQQQQQESDGEGGERQGSQRRRIPGVPWMAVTWMGTSSGSPTPKRNVSAIAGEAWGVFYFLVLRHCVKQGALHQLPQLIMQPASPVVHCWRRLPLPACLLAGLLCQEAP